MENKIRLGSSQLVALRHVLANPGCCTAEVDRACRTARNGHQWMYRTVDRLRIRKLVATVSNGSRGDLYITEAGCRALSQRA